MMRAVACAPSSRTFCRALRTASRNLHSLSAPASHRNLLSKIWTPANPKVKYITPMDRLWQFGFLYQTASGVFHMLPMGLRVQKKLEALMDKYMSRLGACKVELSSISSRTLWEKSGRLSLGGSELFKFEDRRGHLLLLSPTHEEEITSLLSALPPKPDRLPLRLYQISRKYRDEKRPRQRLLRAREFLMKDLYTFDSSKSLALATYAEVREIYARIFDELKVPYLVAEADSGNIGGSLSHEYHLPTPGGEGEDFVITCNKCGYTANEEVVARNDISSGYASVEVDSPSQNVIDGAVDCWYGITKDKSTLVYVWFTSNLKPKREVNTHAIKDVFPDLDSSIEDPKAAFMAFNTQDRADKSPKLLNIVDGTFPSHLLEKLESTFGNFDWEDAVYEPLKPKVLSTISRHPVTQRPLNILRIQDGDPCARCTDGKVKVQKAIEVGHTFHLGTRYSKPFSATVNLPVSSQADMKDFDLRTEQRLHGVTNAYLQMGCHGIGVSRIIGAVACILSNDEGLNWPRIIAPFEVAVIPVHMDSFIEDAERIYDILTSSHASGQAPIDAIIFDRNSHSFGHKIKDVQAYGIPVFVIVGSKYTEEGTCEVECPRLKVKEIVSVAELSWCVRSLLDRL
ncbi:hypothetical protein HYFRA_00008828 [Hymenoscyphus fraxineus]|uniref:proline--tRNA ligase n=1 Tax=Hymenoscyphus fraxineus TaxID=746836 RepID=A0A9N9PUT7_9HELO|nr:hypothetical protein HYFRA_00008828 [Hymenoscyphus fraxineus]